MNFTHVIVLFLVACLVLAAYLFWDDLKDRLGFGDSETIVFARLQMLLGVLMATNLAPILPASWTPYYVIAVGVVGELARRSRADDL
jgi:hypothetical protein